MEFGFRLHFTDRTVFVPVSGLTAQTAGNITVYQTEVEDISIIWRFEQLARGLLVSIQADSQKPLGLKRADTLCLSPLLCDKTNRILLFTNNWEESGHRYPCEMREGREYWADCTGLFPDLSARGTALAIVSPFANIVGACAVRNGNALEFCGKTEFTEGMRAAYHFESDRVLLCEDVTVDEFYDIYRGLMPQSTFPMPKLTGWNTWDYYLDRVTPEDIYENIDALRALPFADKLSYIVLDDGWQKEWGNWTENEKFACGLDQVAKRIVDAGFWAGIWMAPLLMKDTCEGFDSRMDWFLKNEQGEYAREIHDTYILDPTHPQAKAFVLNNYKYLYSCGYRLFKIDYLSCLLSIKNFYDRNATPYSALAQLIQEIQACTGPDAVVLGCSLPIQCGADIAPSMRIAVDIHNHFSHVKWIAESLSWTWMYNNRITRIDPDFMIVRGEETADEALIWEPGTPKYTAPKRAELLTAQDRFDVRWRGGDQFNAVEAETWANLAAISGGNLFLSDRISVLNARGISILENAFSHAGAQCKPRYLPEDRYLPSVWQSEEALLLINWEDVPVTKILPFSGKITAQKAFSQEDGRLTVALLPHESFLAAL